MRKIFSEYDYVNLENIDTREAALADPVGFIRDRPQRLVIDEAQLAPELFNMIQVVSILLDILYSRYSKKAQLICDMLTRSLCFLWMLAATIRSSIEIRTSYLMQESGTDFRAPFWPMRVIMTLGFLILALALLSNAIDCYRKLRAGGKIGRAHV